MEEYTKEPMRYEPSEFQPCSSVICFSIMRGDQQIAFLDDEHTARRIVACVNALEGVPTEVLERSGKILMLIGTLLLGFAWSKKG